MKFNILSVPCWCMCLKVAVCFVWQKFTVQTKYRRIPQVIITIQKNLWHLFSSLHSKANRWASLVSSENQIAWVTQPQRIPFDSCLLFAIGYKLLKLVSHLKLEAGPRFADTWCNPAKSNNRWLSKKCFRRSYQESGHGAPQRESE